MQPFFSIRRHHQKLLALSVLFVFASLFGTAQEQLQPVELNLKDALQYIFFKYIKNCFLR